MPKKDIARARITESKAPPFEPLTPNAETIAAMQAARHGELLTAGEPRNLIASLKEKMSDIR